MKNRLGAALIFLGSLGLFAYGVWALTLTHEMADFIPTLDPEIDAKDWVLHWIVAASCWIFAGVAGAIAAIALYRRKRWSLAVLAGVAVSSVLFDLAAIATGYAKYAYERIDALQTFVAVLFAAACVFAFLRWKTHGSTNGPNA
jgi:membrane protein YdbS with pleckstrin-like domain